MNHAEHQEFSAEERNGVYLLGIESVFDGYILKSSQSETHVDDVQVNGNYIGTSESFETECDDFVITEDGVVDLRYRRGGDDG